MSHLATPVGAYARGPLVSVAPLTPIADVLALLEERNVSAVPVLEEGRPLGVISRTDLLGLGLARPPARRGSAARVDLPDRLAVEVMRRGVLTATRTTPVSLAAKRMVDERVHRLFVTDDQGVVDQVFGTREVMMALWEARVGTPIGTVMTRKPFTIPFDAPVDVAIERLQLAHVHGLVVVDAERWPVGLFTQREALLARALPTNAAVEDGMSHALLCLDVRTPLHRAAAHAAHTRARRVVVVENAEVVGVVSELDFARIAHAHSIRGMAAAS